MRKKCELEDRAIELFNMSNREKKIKQNKASETC